MAQLIGFLSIQILFKTNLKRIKIKYGKNNKFKQYNIENKNA